VLTLATYLYAVCSQLLIVEFVRTRTINICNRQYCLEPTGWLTDEARGLSSRIGCHGCGARESYL